MLRNLIQNFIFCNEGYGLIRYQTDRFGFRNPDSIWDKNIDALLIGDSFTHGACVNDSETLSSALPSKFNVINIGTYGNHAIHLAALEKVFIPAVKPRYAITIFYANDNENDDNSYYWKRYFDENDEYFERINGRLSLNKNIRSFYAKADYLIEMLLNGDTSPDEFIKQYSHIGFFEKSFKYFSLPTIRNTFDNYLKINGLKSSLPRSNQLALETLKDKCKEVGCIPMVMYIPNSEYWRPDPRAPHYAKLLMQYCKDHGIQFIDSTNVIKSAGESAYAPKGPHLSPQGYRLISNLIRDAIK